MAKKKTKSEKRKTRYVAYVATSIDGKISLTRNKMPVWTSKEDWKFLQDELSKAEAVVVGRNTYKAAAKHLRKRNTYVLSSRVKNIFRKDTVTFINPKRVDLRELFSSYKRVAILGGGRVYQTMLEKKLLDEIYVTIEPLIFGRGKEMFVGGTDTIQLHLLSTLKLNKKGSLLLHYQIVQ